jgi:hypothetical protein
VRNRVASAIGLLAFAIVAALGAFRGMDLNDAITRAFVAALVMAVVGYIAGFIAEKAVEEAVDRKEPLRPGVSVQLSQEGTGAREEDRK